MTGYGENARLALDTLQGKPVTGIPIGLVHIMEHSVIERIAGAEPGGYAKDPHGVYIRMLENIGVCMVDQYLATNPLTMGDKGYENGERGATTGGVAQVDGILIDSPEAVIEHMERFAIPQYEKRIQSFNFNQEVQETINGESEVQKLLGPNILKTGYAHLQFPTLGYDLYGYENYFLAFAMYPEVIDRMFKAQADYAVLHNQAVVSAFKKAGLPLYHRLDHDMADSKGLLCGLKPLERSWLPCFERSIRPAVEAGFTLLWHCDGNLSALIPPLLGCGVNGFQGFQYEDGMDYISICGMKAKDGGNLVIQAGISVTRELPMGTPDDIKKQVGFLVENGPSTGLFLAFSSSCVPGTPWRNIQAAIEGMRYYRIVGKTKKR